MNVGDLKKILEELPDDMDILAGRYSDYVLLDKEEWSVIKAVPRDEWVMRSHPTMSEEDKAKEREFLYVEGN